MRPHKIVILGRVVPIHYIMSMEPDTLGFYEDGAIYIDAEMADGPRLQQVIHHEICHAIFDITGLGYLMDEDFEDAICVAMESMTDLYCIKPQTQDYQQWPSQPQKQKEPATG